jgi:MerR family transcriptional regulator, redox-sensitive transcriptional activator SoxR
MTGMTIGEVARQAGVRPSALRYYEEAQIIPRAPRVNGRRIYSKELLDLVHVARFAQSVGFSLAEIRALFSGSTGRCGLASKWKPLARAKVKELDDVISRSQRMKAAIELGLGCGCIRIEDCLPSKADRSRG